MRVELRHQPAGTVARCHLSGGESMRFERRGMYAHSTGVSIESKMEGGLFKGLGRRFAGESMFMSAAVAPPRGGWVDIVPVSYGDVSTLSIREGLTLNILQGAWLGSSEAVELDTSWAGAKMFHVGANKGFVIAASGEGEIIVGAHGALDHFSLGEGETVTIDNDHLVAYESSLQVKTRMVSGVFNTWKSAEGLVVDFTGPGTIITQTRNPSGFLSWLANALPTSRH